MADTNTSNRQQETKRPELNWNKHELTEKKQAFGVKAEGEKRIKKAAEGQPGTNGKQDRNALSKREAYKTPSLTSFLAALSHRRR